MIKFERNPETGILETYKDGKKVGEVITMGDEINGRSENRERQSESALKRIGR